MKRLDRYGSHQADAAKRQAELQKKQEQRFLKQQLAALDLNSQTAQILNDANIVTVGDLIKKVEKDRAGLLALEGFTPKALEEVQAKLAEARATYFVEA
ncbi:MAG: hypothetical protein L6R45_02650 [Anaerolineae bacterium]|nr:hypothetical protein [Anaerolineae bacterium]